MSWTLENTAPDLIERGSVDVWNNKLVYAASKGAAAANRKIWTFDGVTEDTIADWWNTLLYYFGPQVKALGSNLYITGYHYDGVSNYYSATSKYNGASWTHYDHVDVGTDPTTFVHPKIALTPDGTKLLNYLDNSGAGGDVGESPDGTTWGYGEVTPTAGSMRSFFATLSDYTYCITTTASYQTGPAYWRKRETAQENPWALRGSDIDGSYNEDTRFVNQGSSTFTRLFMIHTSDSIVYSSTDGAATWAITKYQSGSNFVTSGNSFFSSGGVDFCIGVNDSGGAADNALYRWDTSTERWIYVDEHPSGGSAADIDGVAKFLNKLWVIVGPSIYSQAFGYFVEENTAEGVQILSARFCSEDETGDIWTTIWYDDKLELRSLDPDDLSVVRIIELGDCTYQQLLDRTFGAWCFPVTNDLIYVYGRMNNPMALNGSPAHVIEVRPTTATRKIVESSFGADMCGDLHVSGEFETGKRILTGIKEGSSTPSLYRGTNELTNISDLPFTAGTRVGYKCLAVNAGLGRIAVLALTPAGNTVVYESSDPYTSWSDITEGYPANRAQGRTLRYLHGN